MALTVEDVNLVSQKALAESRSAGSQEALRALFAHFNTRKNPDLQLVPYSGLNAADKVIADVACKVYCVFIKKPAASATDAWLKGSDHATVAAANGDFVAKMLAAGAGDEHCAIFPDGLRMGTGFTLGSHTTVNGNTKSNVADAPTGFCIVGS